MNERLFVVISYALAMIGILTGFLMGKGAI